MKACLSLLLMVTLAFGSCRQANEFGETERIAVKKDVHQMLESYLEAMREEGLLGEFAYLDASVDFFWVPPGYKSWISYDSVAAVLTAYAPTFRSLDYQWDYLRIDPITPDYASYTGRLHGTLLDSSGTASQVTLLETGIVVKRVDGWKLLSGQSALVPQDTL